MEKTHPTILAIDDNADNLATLTAVLADLFPDATLLTACNGPQGICMARETDPDVILLDIVMPDMDGFAVCRALKRDETLRHIPVVFLTALKTARDIRIAAIDAGAEGFLTKPIDEAELLVQIRSMSKVRHLHDMEELEKRRLTEERERLSELVSIRTRELTRELDEHQRTMEELRDANNRLRESQKAALNLMEDLRNEIEGRKNSEETLRRSEQQLTMAQRVANVGSWVWHIGENRLDLSGQMYAIFDIRREVADTDPIGAFRRGIHPEDVGRVEAMAMRVAKEGNPSAMEFRLLRADESIRHVWLEPGELEHDDNGRPARIAGIVQDITERKQTETVLLEREERWRSIIKASPDGIVLSTLEGSIEEVSDAAIRMLGLSAGVDAIGRNILDFVDEEHHAAAMQGIEDTLQAADEGSREFQLLHGSGKRIWAEINGEVLRDAQGNPVRLIFIMRDITERKKTELLLRGSEERWRSIIRASPDGIAIISLDGIVEDASDKAVSMYGYERVEEVTGRSIMEFLLPAYHEQVVEGIQRLLAGEAGRAAEYEVLRKDASTFWIEINTELLRNHHGEAEKIIVIERDITERQRAEQSVRESEERLRAITESAQDAIVMMDQDARITYWNPAAEHIFGYSTDEAIGKNPHDMLTAPEFIKAAEQGFAAFRETGRGDAPGRILESRARRKDGHEISVSLALSAVNIRGAWHSVAIIRDITDWKLAEHILRESESRFRAMVEHSPIAYQSLDEQGRLLDVNDQVCTLLGRSREELLGRSFRDFWAPEMQERFDDVLNQSIREGALHAEITLMHADSSRIIVDLEGRVQRSPKGRFIRTHCALYNVTERKLAEDALRRSEEFTSAILDSVDAHIAVIDRTGVILDVNAPWTRFALENGSEDATYIGWNYFDVCSHATGADTDVAAQVVDGIQTIIMGKEENFSIEYTCHAPDQERWFLLSATPLDAERQGVVLAHTNITQRKLAERAVRESEALYRSLFDDHSAVKLLIDPVSGGIVDANEAAGRFYGYSREALSTMRIQQINTLSAEAIEKEMAKALNSKHAHYEFRHRLADGSIRDVEVFAGTIRLRDKQYIHSIVHDVTGKKDAERRLRLLGKSVEQSPIGIMITDPDGIIEYVNPELTRMTGFSVEEFIGTKPGILRSGEHDEDFYSDLWRTILEGRDWIGEFRNMRKSGELYWERAIISPVTSESGAITHFIGIKEDITEKRKLLDELVEAKEKAEESDRLKSTFLANMSHEVRTPMNAIIGFSDLLGDTDLTSDDRQQYAAIIRQRSYDLLDIINDILDISLIEAGEMKLIEEACNVDDILNDLLLTFEHLHHREDAHPASLHCINELARDDNRIVTDPRRIKQVLTNLLSNAFKFTHAGSITFGCRRHGAGELLLYVRDTGIGLTPEAMEFIFNRFRQVDESSTRPYGGTGLGLSISRGFVELLGGRIWVESEEGKGSVFQFTIPYTRAE
jgi:PAS domain S-box-containing protein